jgi:hypothetical protein
MLFGEFKNIMDNIHSKKSILYNKYVLYVIFFICIYDLLQMLLIQNYSAIGAFLFTGIFTSFFSKNMIVILFVALVVSFVLRNPPELPLTKESFDGLEDGGNAEGAQESIVSDIQDSVLESNQEPMVDLDGNEYLNESPPESMENIENNDFDGQIDFLGNENNKSSSSEKQEFTDEDLKKLLKDQDELLKTMKEYEPFIESMQKFGGMFGF